MVALIGPYFHPHHAVDDPDIADPGRIAAMGADVFNIHHNKLPNPCINHPYWDQASGESRLSNCSRRHELT